MEALELKRLKLELIRVSAARAELEFRIDERLEEIARLKEHILQQSSRETELTAKIAEAGKA